MRASNETYQKVADYCASYSPEAQKECCKNSSYEVDCDCASCTNCRHFTENEYCDLDLYDQIVKSHQL